LRFPPQFAGFAGGDGANFAAVAGAWAPATGICGHPDMLEDNMNHQRILCIVLLALGSIVPYLAPAAADQPNVPPGSTPV